MSMRDLISVLISIGNQPVICFYLLWSDEVANIPEISNENSCWFTHGDVKNQD